MKTKLLLCGLLSAGAALLAAGSAGATTISTTCTAPVLYQPFLPFGDANWYSLLPGESYDSVGSSGWTLSGGASIQTATLSDGSTGSVLDLPRGARAISPVTCLNNTYPYMRMMLRSVYGGTVGFQISYLLTTGTWKAWQSSGSVTTSNAAWVLTGQVGLGAGPYSGWNYGQIAFNGGGSQTTADAKIYNIYADPHMRH